MTDALTILSAALAGIGLGVFFFGGLWWTVKRCAFSRRPGVMIFVSLIVRMGMILVGFRVVAGDHWQRLLACLLGFVLARFLVVRFIPSLAEYYATRRNPREPEATHAP